MIKFADAVKTLKTRGFVDTDQISDLVRGEVRGDNKLLELLQSLEVLQETIRRHIRGLER